MKILLFIAAALLLAVVEATCTSQVGGVLGNAKAARPVRGPAVEVDVASVIVRNSRDWRDHSGRLQAVSYVAADA